MSKLEALKRKFDESKINRDAKGRFAPKDAAKIIATKINGKAKAKELDNLTEEIFNERYNRYKENGSYKYLAFDGGRTYKKILETEGKEVAEKAYTEFMRKTSRGLAEKEYSEKLEKERLEKERLEKEKFSYGSIMARGALHMGTLGDRLARHEDDTSDSTNRSNRLRIMREYSKKLLRQGIPEEDAIALAKSCDYSALPDRLKKAVGDTATRFYQLTKGRFATNTRFVQERDRGFADFHNNKTINIRKHDTERVVFHEMGHFLEYEDKRIGKAAAEWRDKRATGAAERLSVLTGNNGYGNHEVAFPGNFWDHYLGKYYYDRGYNQQNTEVVSMGLEHFTDHYAMLNLYEKDREHFQFIIGIIHS